MFYQDANKKVSIMHILPIKIRFYSSHTDKKSNSKIKQEAVQSSIDYGNNYPRPFWIDKPIQKGQMVNQNGEIINRHTTDFCRDDIDWAEYGEYLKEKYLSADDADFLIYGCSTGEEPYSLAILLNDVYGSIPNIKAFDISDEIIQNNIRQQKKGIFIKAPIFDYMYSQMRLKDSSAFKDGDYQGVKLAQNILDSVSFKQANILTNLDSIGDSKPAVIMCRNMWPYIKPSEYQDFAKKLYNKLAPNSIVVLGMYDYEGNRDVINSDTFPETLLQEGFKNATYGKFEQNGLGSLVFEK